jgi:type II secretory pathway predicted ATPase ExeA
MYEAHFGFRRRPFRPTPDSESYYPATTHERALMRLRAGLAADDALLLLTSEPGSGKTLVCHRLLEGLGSETVSAFLTNSHFEDCRGLLQALLFELSLPYEGRGPQEMRLALTDALLQSYGAGRRTLVIVDEAQHLSADQLEELRLLGNLESPQGRAVQVLLVGQPRLLETLRRPELAAVAQRLAVRARLERLELAEAADYLLHHLRSAGVRPEMVVTDEALTLLARGGAGVPRLLNQAAHQALQLACEAEAAPVDAEVALEALAVLGLEVGPEPPSEIVEEDRTSETEDAILPRVRRPA